MRLLGDAVFRPRLTEEELSSARQSILYEIEDMSLRPEKDSTIMEMIHEAAWKDNTLGYARFCRPEEIEKITRQEVLKYMKTLYTPERIVVSGVGVDHSELTDLAKEYFTVDNATWNVEGIKAAQLDDSSAVYTGGDVRVSRC